MDNEHEYEEPTSRMEGEEPFELGPDASGDDGERNAAPRRRRAEPFTLGVDASEGPTERRRPVFTPLEKSIHRGREIGAPMLDESHEPSSARLRALGIDSSLHPDIRSDELVTMALVATSEDGGSLLTYSGGLTVENGFFPSFKAHRLLHWHGISARDFLVESECNVRVGRMISEGIRFRFYLAPKWHTYTADVDMTVDGVRHVVEVKAHEDAIGGAEYRMVLAAVAEICRRCGWVFRLVLGPEVFANRFHRENCELFCSRRFVRLSERTMDRFEGFAIRRGAETTYGELAEALDPACPERGEAFIQALTVRQRVDIDLATRVYERTPLRIL